MTNPALRRTFYGIGFFFFIAWVFEKVFHFNLRWLESSTLVFQALAIFFGSFFSSFIPSSRFAFLRSWVQVLKQRFQFLLVVLSLSLFILLIWINRSILHQFMGSADEFSCYFLAQCLLKGKLWADPHLLKEFFTVTHIGDIGGKWFSVYPPGWPILWAPWIKIGLRDVANPFYAACSFFLFLFIGARIYGKKTAAIAGLLLGVNAFFLLNSAAYYSQPSCMLLMALGFFAVLKWREKRGSKWVFLAGVCLGLGLATRYLTVAAFSVAIFLAFSPRKYELSRKLIYQIILFSLPCVFILGFLFLTHFLITGNPFNFPNHYLHDHERLGFIPGYTPITALSYLLERFQYLIECTPPTFVILALLGFLRKPLNGEDRAVRFGILSLPVAYLFYYSWGGNQFGPRYYFEVIPLMSLLAAQSLVQIASEGRQTNQKIAGYLIAVLIFSVPLLIKPLTLMSRISSERASTYRYAEALSEKPALIFLSGFLGRELVLAPEDTVRNDPFFKSAVIYAHDLGPENKKLLPYFPGHHFYRAFYDRKSNQPRLESLTITVPQKPEA